MWVDPIVLPINTQQIQVQGCTEFMMMLGDIAPGCKSTCGLSNISNGAPEHLRPILNRTYAIFLKRYGMYSAIADAFDAELQAIAKGKMARPRGPRPQGDGRGADTSGLSKEETDYVKTARVLLGADALLRLVAGALTVRHG